MLDNLRTFVAYTAWANRRIIQRVLEVKNPPEKIGELFSHLLGAEEVWTARLKTGTSKGIDVNRKRELTDVPAEIDASEKALDGYLDTVGGNVRRHVSYVNTNKKSPTYGQTFETSVEDIFTQLFTHGAYHRGQINALLRAAGEEPVPVDYILYIRERDRQV